MDLDLFGLSLLDYVLVMGLLGAGAFYLLRNKKNEDEFDVNSIKSFNMIPTQDRNVTNTTFVTKMKTHNRNVIVFYGSQTGTAEEFAARLAKECSRFGLKAMVADPEECEMEELVNLKDIPNSLAIFCMATYGEGDPTDNAQEFFEWLGNTDVDLSQINYAVFGLGNKTYEHYNQVAIAVDKKLEKLGANRVIDIGLGDDDGNIEEDFITWKELLWTSVCEKFNLLASGEDISLRQYELKVYKPDELNMDQVYKGEIVRLNSYMNQKTPYHAKNPFMAPITVNRELYKGNRSCMHIELNIEDSKIRYEAGDHVGVYPRNDEDLVNRIGQLLEVDLDTIITLNNVDEDSSKKHPFPCPCSYRSALLYYVDISHTPRTHILKELAEHARDEEEKRLLKTMSSPTEEGKQLYSDYIIKNQRSIVHVLEDMKSVKIPLDQLLEMIPRLQSRYYSISSSPRVHPKSIHLTAVYIEYETPTNRQVKGVATSWMKNKQVLSGVSMSEEEVTKLQDPHNHDSYFALVQDLKCPKVPIFVRKSQFKLPSRLSVPIIMIGPGTGLAPFRGFLQERASLKQKYSDKEMGANILYYGCRHRDQDYLYEQELQSYVDQQVLTKLHVAFSRDQAEKVYVTHLLKQNKQEIWDIIGPSKNGHIYVCGDARTMAKDVREIILEVIQEFGHKSEKEAEQFLKQMEIQRRYSADVWS